MSDGNESMQAAQAAPWAQGLMQAWQPWSALCSPWGAMALYQSWWQQSMAQGMALWQHHPWLMGMQAMTELSPAALFPAGGLPWSLPLQARVAPVADDPQAARLSLRLGLPGLGWPGARACMGPAEWLEIEAVVAHRQAATPPLLEADAPVAGRVLENKP